MDLFASISYQGIVYSCKVYCDVDSCLVKLNVSKFLVDPSCRCVNNDFVFEKSFNIAQNNIVAHVEMVHIERNIYLICYEIREHNGRVISIHINKLDIIKRDIENSVLLLNEVKLNTSDGVMTGMVKLLSSKTVALASDNKLFLANKTGDTYDFIDKRHLSGKVTHMSTSPLTETFANNKKRSVLLLITNKGITSFSIDHSSDNISLQQLHETTFVPSIYCPVILQLLVLNCTTMKLDSKAEKSMCCSSEVFISTSKSQVLKIKNGKIENCMKIPFDDAMTMLTLASSNGSQFILVLSKSGKLCILDENKVIQEIDGIADCYVDDFVGCGSLQLLAFPQLVHQTNNRFLLSDFAFYHIDKLSATTSSDDEDGNKDEKESLKLVVKALQSKLQAKMCELQRAEQVFTHKQELIQKSVRVIENMATGRPIHKICSSSHLVPLLGDRNHDITKQTTFSSTSCGPSDPVITDAPWQRVVQQKWVVGITVSNKSDRTLEGVTLSIVPENTKAQEITFTSNAFFEYKTSGHDYSSEGQPRIKRMKMDIIGQKEDPDTFKVVDESIMTDLAPHNTVCVTLCTDLPQFDSPRGKSYSLCLGWKDGEQQRGISEGQASTILGLEPKVEIFQYYLTGRSTKLHRVKTVGSVSISPQDVLTGRYDCQLHLQAGSLSGIEKRRNLLALNLCQQLTRLQLRSTFSSCQCVVDVLQRHLGSVYLPEYDQHVIRESRTLAGVRVTVIEMFINKCTIAVYARDVNQLLLFIHSLYQHLPDDVIIEPANQINQDKLIEDALSALQKEVSGIGTTVKQAIKKTEEKSAEIKSSRMHHLSKDALSDPSKSRAEFKAIQEEMRNKSESFVDPDDMKKITEVKDQLETQTDLCVEKLGKLLKT